MTAARRHGADAAVAAVRDGPGAGSADRAGGKGCFGEGVHGPWLPHACIRRQSIGQAEPVSVEDVADELYSLSPEEFTAARTAAAKQDKANAKEISALRKPTVGAWLVNTLARTEPDLLEQLLCLGPALAEAQRGGKGDELRAPRAPRRELIAAGTHRPFTAAGRDPVAAARAEVESTLEAALADPATADAVRSGRLTRALSYAGFGGVDLEGAVALGPARRTGGKKAAAKPTTKSGKAEPKPDRGKDIAAAEERSQDAAGALDDAVRAFQSAQDDQDVAEEAERDADAQVKAAEAALHEAREARTSAETEARKARHRTEQAARA